MQIELLCKLLDDVRRGAGRSFSGIGILVSDNLGGLPIAPLRPFASLPSMQLTRDILVEISNENHELHDGFHIISTDFKILLLSQYFSPPIVVDVNVDYQRRLGGRYMAALFGSTLQGVVCSGVGSANYGVAVFTHGREVATLK